MTLFHRALASGLVTRVGMAVAKHLSVSVGYAVADGLAEIINVIKPDVYWVVYDNLRQVIGPQVTERRLHSMVRRAFRNNARDIYELWHVVHHGSRAIRDAVRIPSEVWTRIQLAARSAKGLVLVGTHTGNFDLTLMSLAARGLEIQVLTLASAGEGFDLMDRLRAQGGLRIARAGFTSLRQAIEHLRHGGVVATAVDRPLDYSDEPVEFFGRPAPLVTGHVRLALATGAALLVGAAYRDQEACNTMCLSPTLSMLRTGDREDDLRLNVRRVTDWLEEFIHAHAEQWAMFVPVWGANTSVVPGRVGGV